MCLEMNEKVKIFWDMQIQTGKLIEQSRPDIVVLKAWFPYRCICRICRVCRTKKIHRTDITLWKPPVQMLNTKETTDTTCCTR